MNTKVLTAGSKQAAKHPRGTVRLSLFALKNRRAIMVVTNTTRRVSSVGASVKRSASDPKVRTEARLAVTGLSAAGRRARQVGITKASSDKQVAAQVQRAMRHASRAMSAARRPRPRYRIVRTATILAGVGALGGAAYTGWRVYGRPQDQSEAPQAGTGAPAPAAPESSGAETADGTDAASESTAAPPPDQTGTEAGEQEAG